MKNQYLLILFLVCQCFTTCTPPTKQETKPSISQSGKMKYAACFRIEKKENYKLVTVLNPWNNYSIYAQYALVKRGVKVQTKFQTIEIPIQTMVSLSSSFIEMIDELGELDKIKAIDNFRNIYNPKIHQRKAQLLEVGEMQSLNIEKLIEVKADIVMLTGWQSQNQTNQRMKELGLPAVYNLDWCEKSPLGRAEWIKFIAAFFDKETLADSIFDSVAKNYQDLKQKVANTKSQPKILHGFNYQGVWYMPGGKSFMATFYKDAAGDYFWKNDSTEGSLPLSVETVIERASQADIWIHSGYADELLNALTKEKKYQVFKPFQTKEIYTSDARVSPLNASDYWDSGAARPDRILADLIKIFHPDLLPNYQLFYYRKVNFK